MEALTYSHDVDKGESLNAERVLNHDLQEVVEAEHAVHSHQELVLAIAILLSH